MEEGRSLSRSPPQTDSTRSSMTTPHNNNNNNNHNNHNNHNNSESNNNNASCSTNLHGSCASLNKSSTSKRHQSISIVRTSSTVEATSNIKLDPNTLTFCRYKKRLTIACDDELHMREADMNHIRLSTGLYKGYPLAQALLKGAPAREKILKEHGVKQTNHIKGTDGWMKSMCAWEPRAIDNFIMPWAIVTVNAVITTLLHKVGGVSFDYEIMAHWDTVYSLVLKTSLAFLLVFRLNRCAVRYV